MKPNISQDGTLTLKNTSYYKLRFIVNIPSLKFNSWFDIPRGKTIAIPLPFSSRFHELHLTYRPASVHGTLINQVHTDSFWLRKHKIFYEEEKDDLRFMQNLGLLLGCGVVLLIALMIYLPIVMERLDPIPY